MREEKKGTREKRKTGKAISKTSHPHGSAGTHSPNFSHQLGSFILLSFYVLFLLQGIFTECLVRLVWSTKLTQHCLGSQVTVLIRNCDSKEDCFGSETSFALGNRKGLLACRAEPHWAALSRTELWGSPYQRKQYAQPSSFFGLAFKCHCLHMLLQPSLLNAYTCTHLISVYLLDHCFLWCDYEDRWQITGAGKCIKTSK